jgi:hypothetical protein
LREKYAILKQSFRSSQPAKFQYPTNLKKLEKEKKGKKKVEFFVENILIGGGAT